MWKVIRYVVGALSAIVGLMMQIEPDVATSNLSKWLSKGIENVPGFLKYPIADTWAFFAFLALALMVWFGPWLSRFLKRKFKNLSLSAPSVQRDTKMSEALAYISTRKWGIPFFQFISNSGGENVLSPNEMRQAAVDGDINV